MCGLINLTSVSKSLILLKYKDLSLINILVAEDYYCHQFRFSIVSSVSFPNVQVVCQLIRSWWLEPITSGHSDSFARPSRWISRYEFLLHRIFLIPYFRLTQLPPLSRLQFLHKSQTETILPLQITSQTLEVIGRQFSKLGVNSITGLIYVHRRIFYLIPKIIFFLCWSSI